MAENSAITEVNSSLLLSTLISPENQNSDYYENVVGAFRAYASPAIAIIGIFGNVLVVIVFSTERQRSRFSTYCTALAITHILALLTNSFLDDFFGRGLAYASQDRYYIKLDVYSNASCKFMEFTPKAMYFISSFLVVIFSLDRLLTIFKPLRFYSIYYKKFALLACLGIVVLGLVLSVPVGYVYNLNKNSTDGIGKWKCEITKSDSSIGKFALYFEVAVIFIGPTFVVFLLNCVICMKFQRIRLTRAKLIPTDQKGNTQEMNRVVGHLAVGTSFLLLTLPLVIVMLLRLHAHDFDINESLKNNLADLSRLFSSVKDINYASDFFIYVIFLSNFRWRALRIIFSVCLRTRRFKKTTLGTELIRRVVRFESDQGRRRSTLAVLALNMNPASPGNGHHLQKGSTGGVLSPVTTTTTGPVSANVPKGDGTQSVKFFPSTQPQNGTDSAFDISSQPPVVITFPENSLSHTTESNNNTTSAVVVNHADEMTSL